MNQPDRHELDMLPLDEAAYMVVVHRMKRPRQYDEGHMVVTPCVVGLVQLAHEYLREPFIVGDKQYEFVRPADGYRPALVFHQTEAK